LGKAPVCRRIDVPHTPIQSTRNNVDASAAPSDWFTGPVYIDIIAAPNGGSSQPGRMRGTQIDLLGRDFHHGNGALDETPSEVSVRLESETDQPDEVFDREPRLAR
jgi:hypothetical protein